jgi:hypothetical protein
MLPSDISSLGIVVAGMNSSTLATMSSSQLAAVSVLASHSLSSAQLSSLSAEQAGNLSMDALAPLLRSGLFTQTVQTHLATTVVAADDRALVAIEAPPQNQDRLVSSTSGAIQSVAASMAVFASSALFAIFTRWLV